MWATEAGVSAREATRGHVDRRAPSLGLAMARCNEGTCNSGAESQDVRPPRVEDLVVAMREGGVMARRGRGEGTIYRRADGRREAAFGVGGRRQRYVARSVSQSASVISTILSVPATCLNPVSDKILVNSIQWLHFDY